MSYLVIVAGFGALSICILWGRDVRIFLRTGLPGYYAAAYHGVAYAAIAAAALGVTLIFDEIIGLGLILFSLYLQGMEKREKVFSGEPPLDRLLGKAGRRKDKGRE